MNPSFEEALGTKSGDALADLLEKLATGAWHQKDNILSKAKIRFRSGFEDYLKQTFDRCSKTKTIINRSEPVNIRDIHVPLVFDISGTSYIERAVCDKVVSGQQVVVTGIAGSGKSMSMKSIYLHLAQSGLVVPIFAELRHAAEFDGGLIKYLTTQIGSFVPGFTDGALKYGIREGVIALVLDGFDEVLKERQQAMEEQLLSIVAEAPSAKLLVSGRPHDRYDSWHTFANAAVQNLDQGQVETLISRIQYDPSSKDKLIGKVKSGLFETHGTLLGNPLLCSMMLLTFDEFSDIPSKMYIFYRKAFEVLYRKHDTLKPQYTREFHTNLSEDDFIKLFEVFCYLSFADEVYSFEGGVSLDYADESIKYDGRDIAKASDYLNDLVENVCVLLREGDHFNFLHRSFQEYFAACFVIGRGRDDITDLVVSLGSTSFDTSVVEFMSEMNREALDRTYGKKIIQKILRDIKKKSSPGRILSLFYNEIAVNGDGKTNFYTYISPDIIPKYAVHLHVLEKIYGSGLGYSGVYNKISDAAIQMNLVSHGNEMMNVYNSTTNEFEELASKSEFHIYATKYLERVLSEIISLEKVRSVVTRKRVRARRAMNE